MNEEHYDDAGMTPQGESAIYLSANKGSLRYWNKADSKEERYKEVYGKLVSLSIYEDEGNEQVRAHDVFRLKLTGKYKGEDRIFCVDGHFPSTFVNMVAARLHAFSAGDRMKISVWPGSDNDKVTNAMLYKFIGGEWVKIDKDPDVAEPTLQAIPEGASKFEIEQIKNANVGIKAAHSLRLIKSHSCWGSKDPAPEDPDDAIYGPPDPAYTASAPADQGNPGEAHGELVGRKLFLWGSPLSEKYAATAKGMEGAPSPIAMEALTGVLNSLEFPKESHAAAVAVVLSAIGGRQITTLSQLKASEARVVFGFLKDISHANLEKLREQAAYDPFADE